MTGVRFRQAGPEDARDVLETKRAAIAAIEGGQYTEAQLSAWMPETDALEAFEAAIESDRFDAVLAEVAGECGAYGVLNREAASIDAVFVHPDHTGAGIGASLVGQLEMRAQMHGIAELELAASLNARSFYEPLGYSVVGRKTRTIDGEDIEFATMRKLLDYSWAGG